MSPWSYKRPVHPTWLFLAMLKCRSFKLFKRNYYVLLAFLFQKGGEMSCECKTMLPHSFLSFPIYSYQYIWAISSSSFSVFLFRSHIFHSYSSPKGSQTITWKGVVISLLFLWVSHHNSERPRKACNLQDFSSSSCMLSFPKTFGNKFKIPAALVHMRKIFFVVGFEMEEETPVTIRKMLHWIINKWGVGCVTALSQLSHLDCTRKGGIFTLYMSI